MLGLKLNHVRKRGPRGTSCGSVGFWSNWPLLLSIRFLSCREGPEFWTLLGLMSPLLAFVWPLLQDCVSLVSLLSLDRGWCSVSWSLPMHSSICIGLPWILFCPYSAKTVKTTSRRCFDVTMTLILRHVPVWVSFISFTAINLMMVAADGIYHRFICILTTDEMLNHQQLQCWL